MKFEKPLKNFIFLHCL